MPSACRRIAVLAVAVAIIVAVPAQVAQAQSASAAFKFLGWFFKAGSKSGKVAVPKASVAKPAAKAAAAKPAAAAAEKSEKSGSGLDGVTDLGQKAIEDRKGDARQHRVYRLASGSTCIELKPGRCTQCTVKGATCTYKFWTRSVALPRGLARP
jgi:hypothetical protein